MAQFSLDSLTTFSERNTSKMSLKDIIEFREKVNGNVELQEKIKAGDHLFEIAKEQGFTIDENLLKEYLVSDLELSDFELELVAGGKNKRSFDQALGMTFGNPALIEAGGIGGASGR